MIPYGRQDISQADIDAVVEVLRSDWLTQGPVISRFEQAVANYVAAQHAVAVNSATSALHIACLALGVGVGDWVWTSPNTFVASANCALYCGAQIDFVDIDPRTYNMSVQRLAEKLEQAKLTNRLPKVVIPVHFAGQPCEMQTIYKLSEEYGFKIIEDASHAIGASYAISSETGKFSTEIKVGSCAHSNITVFSFHPVKIITTGEGGIALTNDAELAEKLFRLRTHGITNKSEFMLLRPTEEIWNYQQVDLGFNYRMTDIQAALGLSQLKRLDIFVERRRKIAENYSSALKGLPVVTPYEIPGCRSSFHLYPVKIDQALTKKKQRPVYNYLQNRGIGVNLHYIPVHRHPFYERLGFKKGQFPESEEFHRHAISLPLYSELTEDQFSWIVDSLRHSFVS